MTILVINAGSSSLKFAVFDGAHALLRGAFDNITEAPCATARDSDGAELAPPETTSAGQDAMLPSLLVWVSQHLNGRALLGVGHRIVHGGDTFPGPVAVDATSMAGMAALMPFAPLHQPHNLAPIRALSAAQPSLRQVACFDTAFHHTLPDLARRYALPAIPGLRRYGFHGLSYDWIASQLPPTLAHGRVIAAHLGNGASLCALLGGRSVETTMSTTPLDGLVMGTRCGSLDPGVVLYLLQQGRTVTQVEHLLYHEAGLLGVSGISADMRTLHKSTSPNAAAAIALFAYRIAQQAGTLMAALGGLDGFVFTGGIGEHDPAIRALVATHLAWLGLAIDPALNLATLKSGAISARHSKIDVQVIPTDEEAVIARQTYAVLGLD